MSKHMQAASLLMDIEAELRNIGQWQEQGEPSCEELASVQPFCIDTLSFSQWLQFVFLPRLNGLIQEKQPLPTNCQIAPMAEEYFNGMGLNSVVLVQKIKQLDGVLSAAGS